MVFIKNRINVKYDLKYENDAKKLNLLIENNPDIFLQIYFDDIYLNTDLDSFLKNALNSFLQSSINNKENIILNAIVYLYKCCYDADMTFDENEQSLLKIVVIANYCLLNKQVPVDYVIENFEKIKFDVLNALNNKYRFLLLNNQLDLALDCEETKFWLKNIEVLEKINKMFDSESSKTNLCDVKEFAKLNSSTLNTYVQEFLKKVEPSGKWLKLYNNLVKKGKIIAADSDEDWEYVKENGTEYINAPFEDTIEDFPRLIHEFMHYIGALKFPTNYSTNYYSDEVASIYYERLACLFLETKNYDKKQIEALKESRLNNSVLICDTLITILYYLQTHKDNNGIKKEDILYENIYSSLEDAVDDVNKLFILYSETLTNGSLYIFGQLFSLEALKKNVDMTYFAENSKFMTFNYVLEYFGLEKDLFKLDDQRA